MKIKEQKALDFNHIADKLACVLCGSEMHVTQQSIVCENRHTFDIAKQGYINLLNRPADKQYNEALFNARYEIIQSGLYDPVHIEINQILKGMQGILVDAGSGEGSHLQALTGDFTKLGVDISKDGILLAAKHFKAPLFMVADLANLPLKDKTVDVILNFLSPARYAEFARVLKDDGVLIKVIPAAGYLQEVRHLSHDDYDNSEVTALLKKNFSVVQQNVQYKQTLNTVMLQHLLEMTPLGWNMPAEQKQVFCAEQKEITIDLEIFTCRKKR